MSFVILVLRLAEQYHYCQSTVHEPEPLLLASVQGLNKVFSFVSRCGHL